MRPGAGRARLIRRGAGRPQSIISEMIWQMICDQCCLTRKFARQRAIRVDNPVINKLTTGLLHLGHPTLLVRVGESSIS
jgi:hypothetical protein